MKNIQITIMLPILLLAIMAASMPAAAQQLPGAGRQDVVSGAKTSRLLAESAIPLEQVSTDTLNQDDQALLKQAQDLVSRQRLREAVETYTLLLQRHPRSPLAPQALYEISLHERDQLLAGQALERLLKEYPKSSWAAKGVYRRGEISFIMGDYQQAGDNFEKFLSMRPLESEAVVGRFQLALCRIQLREHRKALSLLTELKRDEPRELAPALIADAIADCRMELDDFEEAIKEWDWIIANHPNFPAAAKANFNVGLCYEALEQIPQARLQYRQVSENFPRSPEAILARLRLEDLDALERLFIIGGAVNVATTDASGPPIVNRTHPPSSPPQC